MSTKIYASQDWVEEKLAELSVEVDPSLAVEGMAADAKAVGEAINEVSTLVGDTAVSEQINTAISESVADWNQNDEVAADYIKNKPEEMSEEDMTDFLIEMGAIQPLSNSAGAIYTNSAGQMYIL